MCISRIGTGTAGGSLLVEFATAVDPQERLA